MAEIKSTLEIIMEKTKGLTMSEEEKAEIRQKELSGKIRGLILKFLDGLLEMERFKKEVSALGEEKEEVIKKIIKDDSVGRFSLDGDNSRLLEMLQGVVGMDVEPINKLLEEYENSLQDTATRRMQAIWEALEQRGIRGSAVVPNLDADPEWKGYLNEATQTFQEKLAELTA